jgi:hypothetical protein
VNGCRVDLIIYDTSPAGENEDLCNNNGHVSLTYTIFTVGFKDLCQFIFTTDTAVERESTPVRQSGFRVWSGPGENVRPRREALFFTVPGMYTI